MDFFVFYRHFQQYLLFYGGHFCFWLLEEAGGGPEENHRPIRLNSADSCTLEGE